MQVILGSNFLVQYHWHWYSVFSHVLLHKTHASLAAPTYRHLPFLVWTSPTIVGATGPLCRLDGHYKGQLRLGKTSRLRKIILYLVENSTAWRLFPIFGHTGEWQDTTPGFVTGIVTNWSTARILDQTETKRQRQNQNRVGKSTKQWLVHGDFHIFPQWMMIISHVSRVATGSRTFKFPINQPFSTGAELKNFDRKSLILNPVSCLWLQQLNGLGARLMGHFL